MLTLTGKLPNCQFTDRQELPELNDFDQYVKMDVSQLTNGGRVPCFFEVFGVICYDQTLRGVTLAQVVASSMLQQKFPPTTSRPSVYIVFNGQMEKEQGHFDSIVACPARPLRGGRTSNAMTQRLHCTTPGGVRAHLAEMTLRIYVEKEVFPNNDSRDLVGVYCCEENDTLERVCKNLALKQSIEVKPEALAALNRKVGPQVSSAMTRSDSQDSGSAGKKAVGGKFQKGTRLLYPLSREWVSQEFKKVSSTSARIALWQHAMTMVCHEWCTMAKQMNPDPRQNVFKLSEVMSPQKRQIVSASNNDLTGKFAPSDAYRCVMSSCERWFTTDRLVKFLCSDPKQAYLFLKSLSNFRASHRGGRDKMVRNDLIRAAEYAQNQKRVQKTHPELEFPVKGTEVFASTEEFCMMKTGEKVARTRKWGLPQLFIFLSLIGGLGVYSLKMLPANSWVTEYGGVVIEEEKARKMREKGLATHMRTLNRGRGGRVLDGRLLSPCDLGHQRLHHQVCFWNRVSFDLVDLSLENTST